MKRIQYIIVVAIISIGFSAVAVKELSHAKNKLKVQEIQLKTYHTELKSLELKRDQLNKELDNEIEQKEVNQQKVQDLEDEKLRLEQEQLELERQLQAKQTEQKRIASAVPSGGIALAEDAPLPEKKSAWLSTAGIPRNEWWAADYLITKESNWNPCAYNPGQSNCDPSFRPSTACGLAQFLPCSVEKAGENWQDPINAIKRQYAYVKARYGGYPQAVTFWNANKHY